MKLRIKGDSLRLRITPSEMSHLLDTGRIQDAIHFAPNSQLTYTLEHSPENQQISVRFDSARLTVQVPSRTVQSWASGSEVGMYAQVPTGQDRLLEVAIEKDFACLDKSDDHNRDTFPNPNHGAAC